MALTSCEEWGLALPSLTLKKMSVYSPLLTWARPDRNDVLQETGWELELGSELCLSDT